MAARLPRRLGCRSACLVAAAAIGRCGAALPHGSSGGAGAVQRATWPLCLWRRGAAWPHGSSRGAWPPCPPTGGAGRRSAASRSTRNEVRLRAHKPRAEGGAEARPGEPTPPATDIGRVGQCQRASN
ncbi:hypothetical protein NDU88_002158 [Pleurodeles waltl]|uniref:Secreted protein n=1 Tax=Pleurodeles waltl TaxID=8319 RepID=A0AAV7LDH0_PLEWA|nr:hypothetical protein NDU88_002158 [Pleurodeles waltl]